jgi:hypothetical protein
VMASGAPCVGKEMEASLANDLHDLPAAPPLAATPLRTPGRLRATAAALLNKPSAPPRPAPRGAPSKRGEDPPPPEPPLATSAPRLAPNQAPHPHPHARPQAALARPADFADLSTPPAPLERPAIDPARPGEMGLPQDALRTEHTGTKTCNFAHESGDPWSKTRPR